MRDTRFHATSRDDGTTGGPLSCPSCFYAYYLALTCSAQVTAQHVDDKLVDRLNHANELIIRTPPTISPVFKYVTE